MREGRAARTRSLRHAACQEAPLNAATERHTTSAAFAKAGAPTPSVPSLLPLLLAAAALVAVTAFAAERVILRDIYGYVAWGLISGGVYLAAMALLLRRAWRPGDLAVILVVALVLRGVAMTVPHEWLTTDGLRYVWDGRIQAAGFNPYLHVPADERLAHLRDAVIYPNINQKEHAVTIYPPFAQMLFLAATRIVDGIEGMKLLMLAAEGLCLWGLMRWLAADGLPRERVIVYAWHPLPIWEFSSQAHIDAVVAALAVLTILAAVRGRQGLSGAVLALAVATKYFPIVFAAALWRRWDWRMPAAGLATLVAVYVPYAAGAGTQMLGFLGTHLDNEGYRAGYGFHVIWYLRDFGLADPPGWLYVIGAVIVLGAVCLAALFARGRDEIRPGWLLAIATVFVVVSSPHYPWYFSILVPLLARVMSWPLLLMTAATSILYLPRVDGFDWSEVYAVLFVAPLAVATTLALWQRRGQMFAVR